MAPIVTPTRQQAEHLLDLLVTQRFLRIWAATPEERDLRQRSSGILGNYILDSLTLISDSSMGDQKGALKPGSQELTRVVPMTECSPSLLSRSFLPTRPVLSTVSIACSKDIGYNESFF